MPLTLTVAVERWPIAGSFAISRGAKTEAVVVVAELGDGKARGRGECVPYARYGESVESVMAQIEAMRPRLAAGLDRQALAEGDAAGRRAQCARLRVLGPRSQAQRPPGARARRPARAARRSPPPIRSRSARPPPWPRPPPRRPPRALLKVKLGGNDDMAAMPRASPRCAPPRRSATLIVDANEGWDERNLAANLAACARGRRGAGRAAAAGRPRSGARAASSGRSRSAPTKARMTALRCRRSPANTTRSTSSSTRPAG